MEHQSWGPRQKMGILDCRFFWGGGGEHVHKYDAGLGLLGACVNLTF